VTLLFTDIVMPGMSGRELAAAALCRSPTLKLLFTTGYEREEKTEPRRGEESAMLRKPFAIGQLARKIR
jgi:CheY-like chemotaxis protein